MMNKTILSAILAGATVLTLSGCFDSGASGNKETKVDKPSGKIAKSLKEVCDNPNVKYDALAARPINGTFFTIKTVKILK